MDLLVEREGLLEAPCWDGEGGVYFSDVIGGGVHRWSPGGVDTVIPKRRGIGGMCLHADGGLVVSGRDVVHVRGDETHVVLTLDGVTGFNDLGVDRDGRVYVGTLRFKPFGGEEPVPGEIWRIDALGQATEVLDGIKWANGVGFSPGGETLYACDYATGEVIAWDGERRVFARSPSGEADGLAVDSEGGVLVATGRGAGVARFSASGELDHVIDVPADFVSSLCFGGADMCDLYVTTIGSLFRTRVEVAGLALAPAAV
jgi:sugar lactone lactonase YvrE